MIKNLQDPVAADTSLQFELDDIQLGQPREVCPGIWWVKLPIPTPMNSVNVYLLEDCGGWTLIDTGSNTADARKCLQSIFTSPPFCERPLRRVITTHFHPDHIGQAGVLVQHGVTYQTSETCFRTAQRLWADQPTLPCEARVAFQQRVGISSLELEAFRRRRPSHFADTVAPPPSDCDLLANQQWLEIGNRRWQVRYGYGHAAEHITLWSEDNIAIVGDQILPTISPNLSVHFATPDDNPIAEWLESCDFFAQFARPSTLCLPGHNRPFRGAPHRCRQLSENCQRVLDRLTAHLKKKPSTVKQCVNAIYRRSLAEYESRLLIAETIGYLNYLRADGVAEYVQMKSGQFLWRSVKNS